MRAAVKANNEAVDAAMEILIQTDLVRREKVGRAFNFTITDTGLIALKSSEK